HLLRNAIDHGIEVPEERKKAGKEPKGTVTLKIKQEDGNLVFAVADDGSGLNPTAIMEKARAQKLLIKKEEEYTREEILDFILMPGFSTTVQANEFSGRGVGMDVVHNAVDDLGGVLEVQSEEGKGSEFVIRVPVSMTSVDSIRCMVGEINCLIPTRSIDHIYAMEEAKSQITTVDGRELFQGSNMHPVLRRREVFDLPGEDRQEYMLVLHGIRRAICIVVGEIVGQQTAVEKSLPELLGNEYRRNTGISGCAIIGDGCLGMVLNVEKLVQFYQKGMEDDARKRFRGE
ncbi:MAG: ATP-binding protein, partial [Eubacteriales bacterium]|nr:ATP-binding protein [Eubacteriales bacterium]